MRYLNYRSEDTYNDGDTQILFIFFIKSRNYPSIRHSVMVRSSLL